MWPGAVVVLLLLLRASATAQPVTTSTTVPTCTADGDCEDADRCTLDRCVAGTGCRHDPVGAEALAASIDTALDVAACSQAPPILDRLGHARTLVGQAATLPSGRRARRLVRHARAQLRVASGRAARATADGLLMPGCGSALVAAVTEADGLAQCALSLLGGRTEAQFACLAGPGPLITLTGTHPHAFHHTRLVRGTRIDARFATFLASPANHYPIDLGGGEGTCLAGATVRGQYDRALDWDTMHAMNNAGVAFDRPTTVDGVRVDDVTDGIRPSEEGPFTIRGVWLSYVRDDCVEDDHLLPGLIEDSLFDGCYVGISERPSPAIVDSGADGRRDLLTIRGSLLRLQPMPGPRGGSSSELGHGGFFKWDTLATELALFDNVFLAEQVGQGGPETMGIPDGIAGCANNLMVWLGEGDYPAPLPSCFEVTRDRGRWDLAVTEWKERHPEVGR